MKKIITVLAILVPSAVMAQTLNNVDSLANRLTNIGNIFLAVLMALAFIFVIWHGVMFIIKAADEEARKAHKSGVIWGIIGLAVILSVWGLVNMLKGSFQTNNAAPTQDFPVVPVRIPTSGN